jgi:predicted esterase
MASAITPHSIRVRRTARYYTLGPTHGFPRELWIVLHGYGQLARRFLSAFEGLDDGSRLIVAPEGLSRFYLDPVSERRQHETPRVGATWMTREDRLAEIEDYIAYLEQLTMELRHHLAGAGPRIVVLGFSQGTATVCRWLASSELRADQIVLWAGGIPPEMDVADWSSRLHGAPLTLVAGEGDELVPESAVVAEGERLSAAGVAFTLSRHASGHRIDPDALRRLAEGFEGH